MGPLHPGVHTLLTLLTPPVTPSLFQTPTERERRRGGGESQRPRRSREKKSGFFFIVFSLWLFIFLFLSQSCLLKKNGCGFFFFCKSTSCQVIETTVELENMRDSKKINKNKNKKYNEKKKQLLGSTLNKKFQKLKPQP